MRTLIIAAMMLLVAVTAFASSVALQWDANTESDLAGYKVFCAADSASFDGAVVVDVQDQTTATIYDLDPLKSYSFAVKAYNSAGMESAFSNVVVVPEMSPPVVTIAAPVMANGAITIDVSATDNVGVAKVEFYINGKLVNTAATAPYKHSMALAALPSGDCDITVKAYDAAGNVGTASRTTAIPTAPGAPKGMKWTISIAPVQSK